MKTSHKSDEIKKKRKGGVHKSGTYVTVKGNEHRFKSFYKWESVDRSKMRDMNYYRLVYLWYYSMSSYFVCYL